MADNYIIKLKTSNNNTSYEELKAKTQQALNATGTSFTWSTIKDNSTIQAEHYLELQEALDAAYAKIIISTSGNSSHATNSATRASNHSYSVGSNTVCGSQDSGDKGSWFGTVCVCYSRG